MCDGSGRRGTLAEDLRHNLTCLTSNSQDHRGTPTSPGRVVTLIERSHWETLVDSHATAPERVWGVAYRIMPSKVAEVQSYLDIREINGYSIHWVPFQPAIETQPVIPRTLVYIGTPDNDQFVGPQEPQELAEHIWRSEGPSGLNRDYLWELEQALNGLSTESGDEHVSDLAERVRMIQRREDEKAKEFRGLDDESPLVAVISSESPQKHDFSKVSSVDEQEETEKTA
jgi:glutathione-specific gamma-glutamylcyclotransferase